MGRVTYLLGEVDGEEGEPPPVPAILLPQVVESPVLPSAPLPLLSPEVAVGEPEAPRPGQRRHHR